MTINLEDYRWLISPAAEPWLAAGDGDPLRLLSRLRKELSVERAHLVAEQIDLRRRARDKFCLANRMFFTRKGLEQATDEQLAAYKANRFPEGESISDLCCGIGGDLLAFAHRGQTLGVDRDENVALLAAVNAEVNGFAKNRCLVTTREVLRKSTSVVTRGIVIPIAAQRATGQLRGELFEPTLESLAALLQRNPHAAIKLAPATDLSADWCDRAEREWLESRGECRQQVAWFGNLARHPGHRTATVLLPDGRLRTIIGRDDHLPPIAQQIGRYLYEPGAAILAAKLTTELCREHNLAAISSGVAYLTGNYPIDDLALAAFEVLDILPFDRKQLRAYCRERNIGRLEIKKRGVEVDPERLRKEIIATGGNSATILIAPHQQHTRAIVASRRII